MKNRLYIRPAINIIAIRPTALLSESLHVTYDSGKSTSDAFSRSRKSDDFDDFEDFDF